VELAGVGQHTIESLIMYGMCIVYIIVLLIFIQNQGVQQFKERKVPLSLYRTKL